MSDMPPSEGFPGESLCLRRARAGDADAYGDVVRFHQARVLGLCLAVLGERPAAEDAAQEIFLKAYGSLGSWREDASFSTWLYRVAVNHCLDALRRRRRLPELSWEGLPEAEREGARLPALPEPGAALEAEGELERLLAALPLEQRLALSLREAQGLRYDEIARVLGCSVDSVKARLRRARRELEGRRP